MVLSESDSERYDTLHCAQMITVPEYIVKAVLCRTLLATITTADSLLPLLW